MHDSHNEWSLNRPSNCGQTMLLNGCSGIWIRYLASRPMSWPMIEPTNTTITSGGTILSQRVSNAPKAKINTRLNAPRPKALGFISGNRVGNLLQNGPKIVGGKLDAEQDRHLLGNDQQADGAQHSFDDRGRKDRCETR